MARVPSKAPVLKVVETPVVESAVVVPPAFHFIEAMPRLMPAALDQAKQDGWQFITIVACRDSNDHVAYFRRD